jgi:hypothetical protein
MPADGTGLPIIMRVSAANSAHRRFMGSFQESKVPDRARKLHGYRINAYVRSGPKAPFDSLPVSAGRHMI